jgi:predicted phosphodiesterase
VAKIAILSDIHGNFEALQAVLADAAAKRVERFFCLGDMIGYGPNPNECLDLCQEFDFCLLGNHENGVLFPTEGFNSVAERSMEWTRRQILGGSSEDRQRRWAFLNRLPRVVRRDQLMFVHGSPVGPMSDYVFPEDVGNRRRMERLFCLIPQVCLQGHTHIPGVFTQDARFLAPTDLPEGFGAGDEKVMVNVGSVGQPRDGDRRASYLIWEDGWYEFQRVSYEFQVTVEKVQNIPELGPLLGDRLKNAK